MQKTSLGQIQKESLPGFSDVEAVYRGKYTQTDTEQLDVNIPTLYYSHPNGEIWLGDAI